MAHKLLLADDSVTIQRVIELTFADEDVEVTTVGDGQLAIERLEGDPPDIVLADVDMPKRDGYEVAAYVKSRPKLAHIPVVLLTGAFEPVDQARAAAAGSTEVLAKPFEPQMVINRVKELLGKKRQEDAERYEPLPSQHSQPPPTAQPRVEEPTPAGRAPSNGSQPVSLDDYFDQLDAAFSNVQPGASRAEDAHDELDWPAFAPSASPEKPAFASGPPADRQLFPPSVAADKPIFASAAPQERPAFAPAPAAEKPAGQIPQGVAAVPSGAASSTNLAVARAVPLNPPNLQGPSSTTAPVLEPPPASVTPAVPAAVAPQRSAVAEPQPPAPPRVEPSITPAPKPGAPSVPVSGSSWPAPPLVPPPPRTPLVPPAPQHTGAAAQPSVSPVPRSAAEPAPAKPQTPAPAPAAPRPTSNPFATLSAAKAEAAARSATPVITEDILEDIVTRVLQRLSDKVVRETVTTIVSETAERLVQEEIERIKNSGSGG